MRTILVSAITAALTFAVPATACASTVVSTDDLAQTETLPQLA